MLEGVKDLATVNSQEVGKAALDSRCADARTPTHHTTRSLGSRQSPNFLPFQEMSSPKSAGLSLCSVLLAPIIHFLVLLQ